MKTFKVISEKGVSIHTGKLKLTDDQARRRVHAISPVKDAPGVYELKAPVMFKRGEEFQWDGEISKAMAAEVIDVAAEAKKQAEKSLDPKAKK